MRVNPKPEFADARTSIKMLKKAGLKATIVDGKIQIILGIVKAYTIGVQLIQAKGHVETIFEHLDMIDEANNRASEAEDQMRRYRCRAYEPEEETE